MIRTRIAPSPTGLFHIGTARTALFNYLFAKKNGGKFILRIEDTDRERSKPEFEKDVIEGLKWLGISYDEGPIHQSERTKLYKKYLEKLEKKGKIRWCSFSEGKESKFGIPHWCKDHDSKYNKPNEGIIRFINPFYTAREFENSTENKKSSKSNIIFEDIIRGLGGGQDGGMLGDFVIAKNLNEPLYNFAVVIDDYEMKISHIIRGEDHISNTARQLLIAEALELAKREERSDSYWLYKPLNWEYAHIPLILGSDRSKLSKRHGAMSVSEYKALGYLPEAIINFMAFLGWNPGDEREIFSLKELEKEFSLEKVQKSGAIFNIEKLDWFNAHYIKHKSIDELVDLCMPYLHSEFRIQNSEFFKKVIALEQPRLKKLSDIIEQTKFFFELPEYDAALLAWKNISKEKTIQALEIARTLLEGIKELPEILKLQELFYAEAEKRGGKGELLWPLRVALSGQKNSPGPFEIIEVLGLKESLRRIDNALTRLKGTGH